MQFHLTDDSRRNAIKYLAAALAGSATSFDANAQENDSSVSFMREAVADITEKRATQDAEADRLRKQKNAAPLFVRIPRVTPFRDWDYYFVEDQLIWAPTVANKTLPAVIVPKGFVSDLASVPRVFWGVFPRTGPYAYAAIVHDYLYWYQNSPRSIADEIMAQAMIDNGSTEKTVSLFRFILDIYGNTAWESNRKLKNAGQKRILARFPPSPLTTWKEWSADPSNFFS